MVKQEKEITSKMTNSTRGFESRCSKKSSEVGNQTSIMLTELISLHRGTNGDEGSA